MLVVVNDYKCCKRLKDFKNKVRCVKGIVMRHPISHRLKLKIRTMKKTSLILLTFTLFACNQQVNKTQNLQSQIDSLQSKLNDSYKPGFGEFMSSIQVHHEKLWFAGINQNWKLADFEINEIKESLDDISQYCTDRPETKSIDMIYEPLENISKAIQKKNEADFKSGYILLTNTCNSCHQATQHAFNVITIPTTPPFSNQLFKLENEK